MELTETMAQAKKVVRAKHPKAQCLYQEYSKMFGVFFDGKPHFIGIHSGNSHPEAYGYSRLEAWQLASAIVRGVYPKPQQDVTPHKEK